MDKADALRELYQAPLSQFVAERKRLATAVKTGGDPGGAKELLARRRPTMSAWVVNQLYWHARDAFDELLATAERLRAGDLSASAPHREAIGKLRRRAATMLQDAGHSPTEATLRRVALTLSALAAAGGFAPDPPGALAEDRDPPGFEAAFAGTPLPASDNEDVAAGDAEGGDADDDTGDGHATDDLSAALARQLAAMQRPAPTHAAERRIAEARADKQATVKALVDQKVRAAREADADRRDTEREVQDAEREAEAAQAAERKRLAAEAAHAAEREREEAERAREQAERARKRDDEARQRLLAEQLAEKKRQEAERQRIAAERHRLEAALRTARTELAEHERQVRRITKELAAAQSRVERAEATIEEIERELRELEPR